MKQEESYKGMILSTKDIGKEYSLCFEITDPVKAECFIFNLLQNDNIKEEDIGVRFTYFNLYGNLSEERNKMLNELIEVINKYK